MSALSQTGTQDKRRSRRFPCRIRVDVHTRSGARPLESVNISRHGMFVSSDEPLRERHVVQLTIHLPDAKIEATAWVSRSVAIGEGTRAGAGIQLFTLSAEAKARWDRFFFDLREAQSSGPLPPARGSQTPDFSQIPHDAASFVVKFKDVERLHEFDANSLEVGGTFLVTPVLRPIGTEVQMIMVHPATDEEFMLSGRIVRLNETSPKGIEIQFHPETNARRQAFRAFVDSGHHLPESPDEAWTAMGRELAGSNPVPHPGVMEPHTSGPNAAAPPGPQIAANGATPNLDIVVGEPLRAQKASAAAAAEADRFDWDKVDQQFMIDLDIDDDVLVDFEITDDLVLEESAAPPQPTPFTMLPQQADPELLAEAHAEATAPVGRELDDSAPDANATGADQASTAPEFADDADVAVDTSNVEEVAPKPDPLLTALETAGLAQLAARVMCSDCDFDCTVTLGDAPGALGLVATVEPFWSHRESEIIAVPRARSEDTVALILDAVEDVHPGTFVTPVPLRVMLDASALARSPRHPGTSEELDEVEATTALAAAVTALSGDAKFVDLDGPCPLCDGTWTVVRK